MIPSGWGTDFVLPVPITLGSVPMRRALIKKYVQQLGLSEADFLSGNTILCSGDVRRESEVQNGCQSVASNSLAPPNERNGRRLSNSDMIVMKKDNLRKSSSTDIDCRENNDKFPVTEYKNSPPRKGTWQNQGQVNTDQSPMVHSQSEKQFVQTQKTTQICEGRQVSKASARMPGVTVRQGMTIAQARQAALKANNTYGE